LIREGRKFFARLRDALVTPALFNLIGDNVCFDPPLRHTASFASSATVTTGRRARLRVNAYIVPAASRQGSASPLNPAA
jgi:hypothetical protein